MSYIIGLVILALIQIESGGNPNAVGDSGKAVGILQMWPVSVQEANRLSNQHYTNDDRYDPEKSIEMARIILTHHYKRGYTNPVELACRWRNPYSKCPDWYRNKAEKAINKRSNNRTIIDTFVYYVD